MQTVVLDALIPREDFEIVSDIGNGGNTRNKTTLSIEDLKYDSFFFAALRKPIFQRETNEWDPKKICAMIESFVDGELIPAIILWRNQSGYIFVIDGAHRLSSLGAWINDDYGDGMGMEQEVELLAARVYGSRSRQDLYREDSDLDVVLSYKGDIREDSFFNALNESGIAMAGIKVDINPIAEERITLAEYIKESEKYLDQQEIKKLAVDLDNFSYDVDTYEYNDTVENREEQVEKLTEDILNKKTETIKDWLLEVSEESDIDSDVITARSLLSRLEDTERFSIFDKQPEQEQPEATISFYVAECMEFPVMGEYHNNLTLEEAIKIYESIPAERLHGIKGIGFDLQDGDENYSGEYELMSADRIRRDLIDMIPHYKESPLVQKAIADMEKYLDEKHGRVKETEHTTETVIGSGQKPSAVAADRRAEQEPVSVNRSQPQKAEPASRAKGEVKKSVLQSLKDFQARAKAQEQNKTTEKSKTHKKGEVEL